MGERREPPLLMPDVQNDAAHGSTAGQISALVPAYVRSRGGVRVRFGRAGSRSMALERRESDGFRLRLPRTHGACEAVLINTGGGMAGGDRMALDVALDQDADVVMTTQAAEKIYRAQGAPTEIAVDMRVAGCARLAWLPQETILFSGSRWRRRLQATMDETATLTIVESTVFGRVASGEAMGEGFFHDSWRITRGGRLVFADEVRLDGHLGSLLASRASANGARAIATVLHIATDAEARLDEARGLLAGLDSECGASAWNGMLVLRLMSQNPHRLRNDLVGLLEKFRHAPMPRCW